ncbi:MAG: SGNH/GDSL hydrolase family protein [Bacteroidales bacterium]
MKNILVVLLVLSYISSVGQSNKAKINFTSAEELTIVGKIFETDHPYHRVDTTRFNKIPTDVKRRLICSSGLAISFRTNSERIYASWETDRKYTTSVLSPVASRGLDLYIKKDGKWQFASVGIPTEGKQKSKARIIANLSGQMQECLLYLPTYSELRSLSIGVLDSAIIEAGEQPFDKRIVIYGSSIVQGAGASRAGTTYPARLSRNTGLNFINLGTSGVAKMQPEVVDMLKTIKADAFVLDCVPNCHPEQITERTDYLVREIRKTNPDVPIIMVQTIYREVGHFDTVMGERLKMQNENIRNEYEKLKASGMENLYFLVEDNFLGTDHEGTIDGTHPSDLGFDRMVSALQPKIMEILNR